MDLQELRRQIDDIDAQVAALYRRRMEAARRIGEYKRENGLPVHDAAREEALLARVSGLAGAEYAEGVRALYRVLLAQSREWQQRDGETERA